MPISFGTITYIANGQAITDTVLNTPSVALESRTTEIKRNSEYEQSKEAYSTAAKVILSPTLEEGVLPKIRVFTEIKKDGTANDIARRYYRVELTKCQFSVFPAAEHGGRYIVSAANLSEYFSDGITQDVLSNNLAVPGDGVYLKVPARLYGGADNLSSYPDTVYPDTANSSTSNHYITADQSLAGNLVKLPPRVKIEVLGIAVSTLETALETLDAFGAGTDTTAITISGTNEVSVTNGGVAHTLSLNGVQGSRSSITKMYNNTGGTGVIFEVLSSTAPIFTIETTPIDATDLSIKLYKSQGDVYVGENTVSLDSASTYTVSAASLDSQYSYIPLVRLTETELIVGGRHINLVRNYVKPQSNSNTVGELVDLHGAPIEWIDPAFIEESKYVDIPLLNPALPPKQKITVRGLVPKVGDKLTGAFGRDLGFQSLLLAAGSSSKSIVLNELRLYTGEEVVCVTPNLTYEVSVHVGVKAAGVYTYLYFTSPFGTAIDLPFTALGKWGSEVTLNKEDSAAVTSHAVPSTYTPEDALIHIEVSAKGAGNGITAGALVAELDFFIK